MILDFLHKKHSKLIITTDFANWSLDHDAREMRRLCQLNNLRVEVTNKVYGWERQCVHYTSQFALTDKRTYLTNNRISVDYYHGLPEKGAEFAKCFDSFCKHKDKLWRVRVSQSEMEKLILSSGIAPARVHRIPIGINLNYFSAQTQSSKQELRQELGIPDEATVIGSFQKDGNGWGAGDTPKLIKGPDVFLKSIGILKKNGHNLWVLLTGPARGYVKNGLEQLRVPYVHRLFENYADVGRYFAALDAYIISSREEGGPKAILESMASGIPLVTTRVGQAIDLVNHNENACLVEIEDAVGLAHYVEMIVANSEFKDKLVINGLRTAMENSYDSQRSLWRNFFDGYVEK